MRDLFGKTFVLFKNFWSHRSGATAILFGLVAIPVMALAGAAIDFGRAALVRTELAHALDAALLAAKQKEMSSENDVDLESVISAYMAAQYDTQLSAHIQGPPVVRHAAHPDGRLTGSVRAQVPTTFLKLVNINTIPVEVSAEVQAGGKSVEVVLVLDTTGSMKGSKMATLKDAAIDLVEALMPSAISPNTKIGLVPFSKYVNIGLANRNEPGIDVPADYTVSKWRCWNTYPHSTRKCKKIFKGWGTCYNDGNPYPCKKYTWKCTGSRGKPVRKCGLKKRKYKWYGCMGSRDYPRNTTDSDYGLEPVPGLLWTWNKCRATPIIRLTNDRETIRSGILAMKARDKTYIPAGLAWGWRLLSKGIPFADGVPYSEMDKTEKVLVLMTDGANTVSPTYPDHNGKNTTTANNLTAELCTNIKSKGIIVYTIAFEVTDTTIKNLLQNCAGNGGKYYDAKDSDELTDAFREISLALMNLRLSK